MYIYIYIHIYIHHFLNKIENIGSLPEGEILGSMGIEGIYSTYHMGGDLASLCKFSEAMDNK